MLSFGFDKYDKFAALASGWLRHTGRLAAWPLLRSTNFRTVKLKNLFD